MKKKILIRVLSVLAILTAIASVAAYFVFSQNDKPWMAFYMACCGGILVFNFLLFIFLIYKNVK